MSLFDRDLEAIAADVRESKLTAVELTQFCLDRIESQSDYHAVLEINPEALGRATQLDQNPEGKLAGIPFIAKDNFLTTSTKTTAASKILGNYRAPYQSTAVAKLEAEGAIMIAKANLDAFAHGSSTENSDFGPTKNPHDPNRVPGGSSGGSAAAVALDLCGFALGTDTGGSIRLPASFCGVVGLKPTYGLVSRFGVVAMGSSVDVIGPLTRSVADAALVLDVMAGRDRYDATTIEREPTYAATSSNLKGLKVGLVKEYMGEGIEPAVREQIERGAAWLKQSGAEVSQVSLPSVDLALACYYILIPAEVSSNLARYDGVKYGHSSKAAAALAETYDLSRAEGFGAEAKRRIMIGTYVLSSGYYEAYYRQAQKIRTLLAQEFAQAFEQYDVLLSPAAPLPAFPLGSKAQDPLAMYLTDVLTVATNLVGCSAISIPYGEINYLPIGLQLIAPQRAENQLLGVAAAIEAGK